MGCLMAGATAWPSDAADSAGELGICVGGATRLARRDACFVEGRMKSSSSSASDCAQRPSSNTRVGHVEIALRCKKRGRKCGKPTHHRPRRCVRAKRLSRTSLFVVRNENDFQKWRKMGSASGCATTASSTNTVGSAAKDVTCAATRPSKVAKGRPYSGSRASRRPCDADGVASSATTALLRKAFASTSECYRT